MSRSYRKAGAYSYSNHGDKWCRNQYHREERRKAKAILRDETNYINNTDYWNDWYSWNSEPADKLVINKIDRSCHFSDRYCWASDGGSWWREDKSELRKDFDKEVFGIRCHYRSIRDKTPPRTIWDDYLDYVERKHNEEHPKLRIYLKRPIGVKKYFSWITRRYEECTEYERTSFEVPYNKAHKFDTRLVPKGWDFKKDFSSYYKVDGYGWSGDSKWDDIPLGLLPLNLKTPQELISWLRMNQERIIKSIWKRRYSK